ALIGLVVSYLSSIELRAYGAQSFIVDIVGLGVVRELGPMLAAILVAGRSGSSMTAQLGVMRLTQELDALTAMGISPTVRLVLPKVLALLITMPLLVVWTDALALAGGMVAAKAQLGLGFLYFLGALPGAVPLVNLWIGLGKGAVFGVLVGLTAGHF
ncbi:ABC transporter permease protein, partial [mine drainage metagenome]